MSIFSRRSFCALLSLAAVAPAAPTLAADQLPAPAGAPILTISGQIRVFNVGQTARFDRAMLEAFGMQTIVTRTPWFDGAVRFEGVPMKVLLEAVGANGAKVVVTALNDYTMEIPTSDFSNFNVLLALKRDGHYMAVQDKGPLFIIYPFDSDPRLQNQEYYGRSVWQVAKIVVE